MSDTLAEQVEGPGFDRIMKRLRDVIELLEAGNLSMEESLKMYEEGISLARQGHQVLDDAEKRVELLVRDGREGAATSIPFDDDDVAGESQSGVDQSG